jgi:tRNA G18 (ribose-2'-O)-methylase SpoU
VVASARQEHVRVAAAVPRGGTPLAAVDFSAPMAFILGNEGGGVSDIALSAAHDTVTIPMLAPVESLNVTVAAALILYEASRQRGA